MKRRCHQCGPLLVLQLFRWHCSSQCHWPRCSASCQSPQAGELACLQMNEGRMNSCCRHCNALGRLDWGWWCLGIILPSMAALSVYANVSFDNAPGFLLCTLSCSAPPFVPWKPVPRLVPLPGSHTLTVSRPELLDSAAYGRLRPDNLQLSITAQVGSSWQNPNK